jgi:hypothetical protein
MKDVAIFTVLMILLCVLAVAGMGAQFLGFKIFAPLTEQVRYDTFKESQAYNDGMARELSSLRLQWASADIVRKSVIKAAVLQQYGAYDRARLPADLQSFMDEVERF